MQLANLNSHMGSCWPPTNPNTTRTNWAPRSKYWCCITKRTEHTKYEYMPQWNHRTKRLLQHMGWWSPKRILIHISKQSTWHTSKEMCHNCEPPRRTKEPWMWYSVCRWDKFQLAESPKQIWFPTNHGPTLETNKNSSIYKQNGWIPRTHG